MPQGSWEQLAGERALATLATPCVLRFGNGLSELVWQWKHLWHALKIREMPCAGNQVFYIPSKKELSVCCLLNNYITQSRLKVETTTSASIKNSDSALPFPWNVDSGSTKPGFAIVCISPTISYASITIDQACPTWTIADLVCERSNVPLGLFDFTIFFLRDVNQCERTISWIHFVLCNRVWQWTSDLAQQKISLVCTSSGSRAESEFRCSVSSCAEILIQMLCIRENSSRNLSIGWCTLGWKSHLSRPSITRCHETWNQSSA